MGFVVLDEIGTLWGSRYEAMAFGDSGCSDDKLMSFLLVKYIHLLSIDEIGCAIAACYSQKIVFHGAHAGLIFAHLDGEDLAVFSLF